MATERLSILDSLENLSKRNYDRFCMALVDRRGERKVTLSMVEDQSRTEVTNALVSTFTKAGAPVVVSEILRLIGCFDEAEQLDSQIACIDRQSSNATPGYRCHAIGRRPVPGVVSLSQEFSGDRLRLPLNMNSISRIENARMDPPVAAARPREVFPTEAGSQVIDDSQIARIDRQSSNATPGQQAARPTEVVGLTKNSPNIHIQQVREAARPSEVVALTKSSPNVHIQQVRGCPDIDCRPLPSVICLSQEFSEDRDRLPFVITTISRTENKRMDPPVVAARPPDVFPTQTGSQVTDGCPAIDLGPVQTLHPLFPRFHPVVLNENAEKRWMIPPMALAPIPDSMRTQEGSLVIDAASQPPAENNDNPASEEAEEEDDDNDDSYDSDDGSDYDSDDTFAEKVIIYCAKKMRKIYVRGRRFGKKMF
ncbi:uncharacterized protein LOC133501348 isoform X1 [Syngnathoides biaculeatus]|uniref:uncharacterized protein LOC133501348 isoform X1 n=1 Tax=Syngnathoides biaculeatus TaxID=300417 RepID=UPI002ADDC178|nr:uncharacterized protein LOC133501348 isoform X1 [Syngnathoides biaculeatus]